MKPLGPGLAPLKGEGSLAPLGRSLGTSSPVGGTFSGGSLGTGPIGRGSLGGTSSSLGKGPLNGSLGTGSMGGFGSGSRFPTAGKSKDPFQNAPLGGIKDSPEVSKMLLLLSFFCLYSKGMFNWLYSGIRIDGIKSRNHLFWHSVHCSGEI